MLKINEEVFFTYSKNYVQCAWFPRIEQRVISSFTLFARVFSRERWMGTFSQYPHVCLPRLLLFSSLRNSSFFAPVVSWLAISQDGSMIELFYKTPTTIIHTLPFQGPSFSVTDAILDIYNHTKVVYCFEKNIPSVDILIKS